ncbi:hypothetical protein GCM10010497_26940 [Streptomyces cinereoruber]|uniref:Uncharacterized protein n=1 Tax=Streptomyces cinereoruber TaxID=67260 RepID=A0AAV4KGC1_9ACTN|nr:hypothetical protein GCM10010497_26940 [Streptomyces cinereoruber]
MTTHCIPEAERPSSAVMFGAAIETIVWSMNVIDTAKSMAASASFWRDAREAAAPSRVAVELPAIPRWSPRTTGRARGARREARGGATARPPPGGTEVSRVSPAPDGLAMQLVA